MEKIIGENFFGISTSIDLIQCRYPLIRSVSSIQSYIDKACDLLKMKKYGDSNFAHFGEDAVKGYTFTQLIETSLISGHFREIDCSAYIDIFSCKEYDPEILARFTSLFFMAKIKNIHTLYRG